MTEKRAIFVAATGQNVGKTTTCLGIISGLNKRFDRVGFIKPVGQQHIPVEGDILVDKDVALFKDHFGLKGSWPDMSPVIFPAGFTRDFIDGKVQRSDLTQAIDQAFATIHDNNDFTIVEGTGHVGVGSIVGLNNAIVAARLGLDMVIVVSGGLGSAFDELALNVNMAAAYGVHVRGVILNRVIESKRAMIQSYFPRALKAWGIPVIGCIPYSTFLDKPSMRDYENLFGAPLLSGKKHRYRRFAKHRIGARSLDSFMETLEPNELTITPATREDLINACLDKNRDYVAQHGEDATGGLILTGRRVPSSAILDKIQESEVPVLYAPVTSYDAMQMITHFIAKIRRDDVFKIAEAIKVVEANVDFEALIGPNCVSQRSN